MYMLGRKVCYYNVVVCLCDRVESVSEIVFDDGTLHLVNILHLASYHELTMHHIS